MPETSTSSNDLFQTILAKLERFETRLLAMEQPVRRELGLPLNENELNSDHEELEEVTEYDFGKSIKLIPEFNGSGLENFIHLIRLSKKKTKRNERLTLLHAIIAQKLVGKAANTIRADAVKTFADFFERLRILFGEKDSLESLQRARDSCIMGKNEGLESFTSRFMQCQDKIRQSIDSMNITPEETFVRQEIETSASVSTFLRNIREEFEIRIRPQKPKTLNECFNIASEINVNIKDKRRIENFTRNPRNENPVPKPRFSKQTNIEKCNHCKNVGHTEDVCRGKLRGLPPRQEKTQNFQSRSINSKPPDRVQLNEEFSLSENPLSTTFHRSRENEEDTTHLLWL